MTTALEQVQDSAVNKFANKKAGAQFDPTIILVIAEMVMTFIEVLQDCRDPQEATEIVNDPTWLQKRYVAMRVRRAVGRNVYRDQGADIVDALLETGQDIDEELMTAVYQEL